MLRSGPIVTLSCTKCNQKVRVSPEWLMFAAWGRLGQVAHGSVGQVGWDKFWYKDLLIPQMSSTKSWVMFRGDSYVVKCLLGCCRGLAVREAQAVYSIPHAPITFLIKWNIGSNMCYQRCCKSGMCGFGLKCLRGDSGRDNLVVSDGSECSFETTPRAWLSPRTRNVVASQHEL